MIEFDEDLKGEFLNQLKVMSDRKILTYIAITNTMGIQFHMEDKVRANKLLEMLLRLLKGIE